MKNILLILVGGTICTALNQDGNLSVSDKAGLLLKENYLRSDSPYVNQVAFEATENLYVLSENMTVHTWNRILETYEKYTAGKEYDGILIAHGTDTLAYSTAVFSMLFSHITVPVFFVSANENLESDRANGNENFRCAVECICRGITPNVYAAYKNLSDGQMYIHLGSRLRQCENYSEDFYSVGAVNVTGMTEDNYRDYFGELEKAFPKNRRRKAVDWSGGRKLKECVLVLTPYVGMDYSCYRYHRFSAVLHGAFHSGTACAEKSEACSDYHENSILYMLDRCFETDTPVDVYFSPSQLKKGTYETVSIIGNHQVNGNRIRFLYGYTNEMAYAKLVIAYSLLDTPREREAFLGNEYNFELVMAGS